MKQESPLENLFHYLHWRGDLSFAQAPFCPVDNLIFCCLSYLNWGIPASGSTPETAISLKDAAAGNICPNLCSKPVFRWIYNCFNRQRTALVLVLFAYFAMWSLFRNSRNSNSLQQRFY